EREALVREKGGSRGAAIPREKYDALKKKAIDQGLWAMAAPEALGGGGLSALGACLVAEELGKTFVDFDFGDVPPILFDANKEQQEKYLAPVIAGEKECALALRELDENEITTRAMRDNDEWVLNGAKFADDADIHLVFADTEAGTTCFIVEGLVTQDGKLKLDNVRVPASNVLGEIGGAFALGKEYRDARTARGAARKVGIAARLLEMSAQYARDWKALGQPLAVRPAVQSHLAEMAIDIDAARWLVYHAACEIDESKDAREDTARANLFASEMARRAIDRTIEIHGGPAHAADLPLLRVYRDVLNAKTTETILQVQQARIANLLVTA
ncbi:MAG: acyl-CoA dehydrogenase family protein, partial [Chloroflexota bacterium]|nr:acyl-CoA dehydrogenase family protein [Chloroflexota bacterium]